MSRPAKLPKLNGQHLLLASAIIIFSLFAWLTVTNQKLEAELPRLRLDAGRAQSMASAIREAQARPQKQWTADALVAALNALAKQQQIALRSENTGQGVRTTGKGLPPEALTQWLATAQREIQLAPSAGTFETLAGEGAIRLDVRIDWQTIGGASR